LYVKFIPKPSAPVRSPEGRRIPPPHQKFRYWRPSLEASGKDLRSAGCVDVVIHVDVAIYIWHQGARFKKVGVKG